MWCQVSFSVRGGQFCAALYAGSAVRVALVCPPGDLVTYNSPVTVDSEGQVFRCRRACVHAQPLLSRVWQLVGARKYLGAKWMPAALIGVRASLLPFFFIGAQEHPFTALCALAGGLAAAMSSNATQRQRLICGVVGMG